MNARLARIFREHALFIILIVAYACVTIICARCCGVPCRGVVSLYSQTLLFMTVFFAWLWFVIYALRVIICDRPEHPARYICSELKSKYLTFERLPNALPVFITLPLFMSSFTLFKSLIPFIKPFCWDYRLAQWDKSLHGVQPWQLTQIFLNSSFATCIVNFFYNAWFFVMFAILFWQGFSLNRRLRMQFLLTFILSWILLGTVGAIVFSSAGPCFYDNVVQDNTFKPLMNFLAKADKSFPIWAVGTQIHLWNEYQARQASPFSGISAMPSMHVAMAFLFFLVGWKSNKKLGVLLLAFTILIMIGCVHLGWHYAIDGYAGLIGTLLIWYMVGRSQVPIE